MHDSVLAFAAAKVVEHGLASRKTLEIGSLDVNGSTRTMFSGEYLGLDLRPGPGVDLVASGHAVPLEEASVEVVVCTEVLEHDPAYWRTLSEIRRVLVPGGHLILTTRGNGFGEHREPVDLWRFMPQSIPVLAELAGCEVVAGESDPEVPGVFLLGVRRD